MNKQEIANEFLIYVNDNYDRLIKGFQKSSYKTDLDDDVFQDSILKVYGSIIKNGFKFNSSTSGKSFENYLFITCSNEVLQGKNKQSKNIKVDVESNYEFDLIVSNNNDYLYEIDDELNSEFERLSEDMLVDDILQYCKRNHSHLDCGIFEFYFRSGLGYRKLAEITGFSFRTIFVKINKIKTDIIEKFYHKRLNHRIKIKNG